MKLLMERWNKFLNEQEEAAGGVSSSDLLQMSLPQFVGAMQSNKKELIQTILAGSKDGNQEDDMVSIEPTTVRCSDLRPTQAEVVFKKSIPFALERPKVFMEYYKSDGPFKVGPPGNDAIIVLNGKYVLDGHHRWSSLFCVNPNAQMYAFNIKLPVSPTNALKLLQASIKAYAGSVPSNKGGGVNLFTIDEKTLNQNIMELVTPELAQQYIQLGLLKGGMNEDVETGRQQKRDQRGVGEAGKEQAVERALSYIYTRNVAQMKQNNRPVSGATSREPMPQTDAPAGSNVSAGGDTPAALEPLEKGKIDFRSPFATDRKAAE